MSRFRPEYRELSEIEKKLIADIKHKAEEMESLFAQGEGSRYKSLAITALEEAVMWAVKDVTS